MKALSVSRPILFAILVLMIVQFACGVSSAAPSPNNAAPTSAPPAATGPAPASTAGGYASAADAQAMLQLAVQHYQAVGRDQALADFSAGKAPFVDRDLYVVCMTSDHVETANGGFPQYVGSSADLLKDVNGNPLGKVIWDAASSQSQGSVSYQWINPVSQKTESKTLFFQKVDKDVCGVGIYNP